MFYCNLWLYDSVTATDVWHQVMIIFFLNQQFITLGMKADHSNYKAATVKNKRSELNIFLFSFIIFILFLIYFPLFYF